jgi:hypothetical protein
MQINKTALASGSRSEILTLARSIRPSTSLSKADHPFAAQFFQDDTNAPRPLSTSQLAESLAGAGYNATVEELVALGESQHQGDGTLEAFGIKFKAPQVTGDVSQIGSARARSGWVPAQPVTVSGTEKILAGKLSKAAKALPADSRAVLDRVAKADTATADTGVLVETLKAICAQLIGTGVEHFTADELKVKIASGIKARPAMAQRLVKALQAA